ncbi:MAG TPA: NAD(P)/FAD-dependent oxidoreductase [Pedobacter sp.]|nr:NAD(P)/FAD-dependent oxidoreductase [Pedobacter sp.]
MPKTENDVVIIGGGLAGLCTAIHLRKLDIQVVLIEKNSYPQHKVCGEYVSNEVLPYLYWLGVDPFAAGATALKRLDFSSAAGRLTNCDLPLGGFGLSRYALDSLLYDKAVELGCVTIADTVGSTVYSNDSFAVQTLNSGVLHARIVIGAYGKRSALDQRSGRKFIQTKSPWLAVKSHYAGEFADDLVALHNFDGGYCGVSKVENGVINICYLTDYAHFKACRNTAEFEAGVVCKNPFLKQIFEESRNLFDQPLSISQVSFESKDAVHDHMIMVGDTAGLIHPLCGNGMAMAIHGAKIAAVYCSDYVRGRLSRTALETNYLRAWNRNFKSRLAAGRLLSNVLQKKWLFEPMLNLLVKFPALLPAVVKRTHGQPFN